MPDFETIPLNVPGAGGLDLVSEFADVNALRCRRLVNLDIVPAVDEGGGPRVLPRGLLRRWGYAGTLSVSLALAAGAGLSLGAYRYLYIWQDGGAKFYASYATITTTAGNQQVTVSGWPGSGTVWIYRTVAGGNQQFFFVATQAGSTATYVDSTADGSLGAVLDLDATLHPLDTSGFAQAVRVHWMGLLSSKNETTRVLVIVTSSGTYYAYPDSGEAIQQATGSGGGTTRRCSVAAIGDLLFVANGGTSLKYLAMGDLADGLQDLTQPATPTLTFVSFTGAAGLTTVTAHKYLAIRIDPQTGVRSLPSNIITIAPGGPRSVNLSVTAAAGVDFEIYRTSDGGQFFQYLKTVAGGAAFSDTALDATLSQKTASASGQFSGVPDSGFRLVAVHKNIVFAGNKLANGASIEAAPSLLVTSGPDPFNFPQDPFIAPDFERQIDEDDGDELSGLYSWGEVLLLFKKRRVYQLMGDPPTGFRWAAIPGSNNAGCVALGTIQETPAGLLWLSPAGVMLMREPGAPPALVSEALRDVLIDPERLRALDTDTVTAPRSERPALDFNIRNTTAAALTGRHVRVQFSTTSNFAAVIDYDTNDATERAYFLVNNADYPAAGIALGAGGVRRMGLRPPAGGLTAGTFYYVRWALGDGSTWGSWSEISAGFTWPASDTIAARVVWNNIGWAFALHMAKRQEYFLFVSTADSDYCDTCYVLHYGALAGGTGGPLWRGPLPISATAGCVIENWQVNNKPYQDYMLLASPDGLLFAFPYLHGLIDHDTRATLTAAQRNFTGAAVSGATFTPASSPGWATDWPGLRGQVIAVRDAAGETFTGVISSNTASAATVYWLAGRSPAGTVAAAIGGLETMLETGWLNLSGDRNETAILRELQLHALPPRATLRADVFAADSASNGVAKAAQVVREIPVGEGFGNQTARIDLSGHLHKLRLSAIDARPYELSQVDLGIERTGSHL